MTGSEVGPGPVVTPAVARRWRRTGVRFALVALVVMGVRAGVGLIRWPVVASDGFPWPALLWQGQTTATIMLNAVAGVMLAAGVAAGLASAAAVRVQRTIQAGRWHDTVLAEEVGEDVPGVRPALDGPEAQAATYVRWCRTVGAAIAGLAAVYGAVQVGWYYIPPMWPTEAGATVGASVVRTVLSLVSTLSLYATPALGGVLLVAGIVRRTQRTGQAVA